MLTGLYSSGVKVVGSLIDGNGRGLRVTDADGQYGDIQKNTDGSLHLYNREWGGNVKLSGQNISGTYKTLLEADPDGSTVLYHAGASMLYTSGGGVTANGAISADSTGSGGHIALSSNKGAIELTREAGGAFIDFKSSTGEDFDARIVENAGGFTLSGSSGTLSKFTATNVDLYYAGTLSLRTVPNGFYQYDTSGNAASIQTFSTDWTFTNEEDGGLLILRGFTSGHALANVMIGDPDGAVSLYYAGSKKFDTTANGFYFTDGTDTGELAMASGQLYIKNLNHGGNINIAGEKADGSYSAILIADPDYGLSLYFGGTACISTTASNSKYGIHFSQTSNKLLCGTGSPEGAITAVVGSMYLRTDGGTGTTLYIKESGTGNTGWIAK